MLAGMGVGVLKCDRSNAVGSSLGTKPVIVNKDCLELVSALVGY